MADDEAKKGSEDKEKLEESILAEIKASEEVFKKGAGLKEIFSFLENTINAIRQEMLTFAYRYIKIGQTK